MDLNDFNITFHRGDCAFLRFVLMRFKDRLPYEGRYQKWALLNNYSDKVYSLWNAKGRVSARAFNALHKDLAILRQNDPSVETIQQLFAEFNAMPDKKEFYSRAHPRKWEERLKNSED